MSGIFSRGIKKVWCFFSKNVHDKFTRPEKSHTIVDSPSPTRRHTSRQFFSFRRIADNPPSAPQTLVTLPAQLSSAFAAVLCALRSHATLRLNSVSPKTCLCFALNSRVQLRCLALLAALTSAAFPAASSASFRWRVAAAASRRRRALSSFSARQAAAATRFPSWIAADSSSPVRACANSSASWA